MGNNSAKCAFRSGADGEIILAYTRSRHAYFHRSATYLSSTLSAWMGQKMSPWTGRVMLRQLQESTAD